MRWDDFRRSDNVEDRRGDDDSGYSGGGGGGFGLPIGRGGFGIGTIVVVSLIGWALGIDPRILLDVAGGGGGSIGGVPPGYERFDRAPPSAQPPGRTANRGAPKDEMGDFVAAVLGEIDDRWTKIFRQEGGGTYRGPRIVLFRNATDARQ